MVGERAPFRMRTASPRLSRGGFGNPLRSRLPIAATIPSATPFSMLRFVGPII
jgi:hypothetical protein